MATFSTHLGLKLNSGSDPFLLSDFIGNWNILDSAPGTYVCTSLARPSWGSAQAGRLIFMTDLKQLSYWDGGSWQDLRDGAPVFVAGTGISTWMSKNTSPVFTIMNFTSPRPCALTIIMTAAYQVNNTFTQDVSQRITFDGSDLLLGGWSDWVRFVGGADSGNAAGQSMCSLGVVPSMAAGTHRIGIKCIIGGYNSPVLLNAVKVIAVVSVYNSSNVL